MIKLLPYILFEKYILYFSIGNGQPRESALCQLYRHTFVPYGKMVLSLVGSVLCGLMPTLYAAGFDVFDDLMNFYHTHHAKLMFQGIPVVILWSVFLAAAIQLHIYALYFAWSLLRAWKQRAAELRAHKAA